MGICCILYIQYYSIYFVAEIVPALPVGNTFCWALTSFDILFQANLEWAISPGSSGSFYWEINRKTKIWAPSGYFYVVGCFLMRQYWQQALQQKSQPCSCSKEQITSIVSSLLGLFSWFGKVNVVKLCKYLRNTACCGQLGGHVPSQASSGWTHLNHTFLKYSLLGSPPQLPVFWNRLVTFGLVVSWGSTRSLGNADLQRGTAAFNQRRTYCYVADIPFQAKQEIVTFLGTYWQAGNIFIWKHGKVKGKVEFRDFQKK